MCANSESIYGFTVYCLLFDIVGTGYDNISRLGLFLVLLFMYIIPSGLIASHVYHVHTLCCTVCCVCCHCGFVIFACMLVGQQSACITISRSVHVLRVCTCRYIVVVVRISEMSSVCQPSALYLGIYRAVMSCGSLQKSFAISIKCGVENAGCTPILDWALFRLSWKWLHSVRRFF